MRPLPASPSQNANNARAAIQSHTQKEAILLLHDELN